MTGQQLSSQSREPTFLDLSPVHSSPAVSPASTHAGSSPINDSAPAVDDVFGPLSKLDRSGSTSSASSTQFLVLNPDYE
ncbi:hypothetical protein Tdes44962_MAKER09201 [Teratosphaeria destructans]|uniref:Uncharacterized protein n=1 Tax=Teratosphaeria destructans TaxID=418781 RepID=A0A9W7SU59_9PEZI|nr:hypothetical protein Tdes44962_MAKER09201 [Teratosphaeria destructans]